MTAGEQTLNVFEPMENRYIKMDNQYIHVCIATRFNNTVYTLQI